MAVKIDFTKMTFEEMAEVVVSVWAEVKRRNPIFVNSYETPFAVAVMNLRQIGEAEKDNFTCEAGPGITPEWMLVVRMALCGLMGKRGLLIDFPIFFIMDQFLRVWRYATNATIDRASIHAISSLEQDSTIWPIVKAREETTYPLEKNIRKPPWMMKLFCLSVLYTEKGNEDMALIHSQGSLDFQREP